MSLFYTHILAGVQTIMQRVGSCNLKFLASLSIRSSLSIILEPFFIHASWSIPLDPFLLIGSSWCILFDLFLLIPSSWSIALNLYLMNHSSKTILLDSFLLIHYSLSVPRLTDPLFNKQQINFSKNSSIPPKTKWLLQKRINFSKGFICSFNCQNTDPISSPKEYF